jgi:hypothetical protein
MGIPVPSLFLDGRRETWASFKPEPFPRPRTHRAARRRRLACGRVEVHGIHGLPLPGLVRMHRTPAFPGRSAPLLDGRALSSGTPGFVEPVRVVQPCVGRVQRHGIGGSGRPGQLVDRDGAPADGLLVQRTAIVPPSADGMPALLRDSAVDGRASGAGIRLPGSPLAPILIAPRLLDSGTAAPGCPAEGGWATLSPCKELFSSCRPRGPRLRPCSPAPSRSAWRSST